MIGLVSLRGHVVALDRSVVLTFVRECQLTAGKFAGLPPHELGVLLRHFAAIVPNPSALVDRVLVQLIAVEIVNCARRAAPGWRTEWETELTFGLGSEVRSGAAIRRAIEQVAVRISGMRQIPSAGRPETTLPQRKVHAALEVVRNRYNEPGLGLRAVASHVLLTPSHLDRLLTRHTGYSFLHHLRGARLEAAQQILSSTMRSIKEVAAEVGYNSVTHLDRDFRRHVGCSPSHWRCVNDGSATATPAVEGSADRSQDLSNVLKK